MINLVTVVREKSGLAWIYLRIGLLDGTFVDFAPKSKIRSWRS